MTHVAYINTKQKESDSDKYELKLVPKRFNDQRISNHNNYQLKFWRANVDFTLLYDYQKVVNYVTKYASKSEKSSNVYKSSFQRIFSDELIKTH